MTLATTKNPPISTPSTKTQSFSLPRSLRLSSFQIGSAMGEILTASVWNRVMISDLGMPATPVGLLLALQYILLPISLWVGHRSDTIRFLGRRRDSYIWLGRSLMVFAFPLLGVSIGRFESGDATMGWLLATFAFLLFGGGKLASGSVFLALVRESVPTEKRGLAISLTETVLIAMFPIVAIGFGRWMESYNEAVFWQMIIGTALMAGFFWLFSVLGIEKHVSAENITSQRQQIDFRNTFRTIWGAPATRAFFLFLGISTCAAWMQDNILEPFGGDVLSLGAGDTTRFTGYWGGATVIVVLACFYFLRQRQPEQQVDVASLGLAIMAIGMALIAFEGLVETSTFIIPSLLVFGIGFGFYTFGALNLMAVMSPGKRAGAYLGLWTACILLTKGFGTFLGGALRDLFMLTIGLTPAMSYAIIFFVSAAGLAYTAKLVRGIDFKTFVRDNPA